MFDDPCFYQPFLDQSYLAMVQRQSHTGTSPIKGDTSLRNRRSFGRRENSFVRGEEEGIRKKLREFNQHYKDRPRSQVKQKIRGFSLTFGILGFFPRG